MTFLRDLLKYAILLSLQNKFTLSLFTSPINYRSILRAIKTIEWRIEGI
jgi:hypothetical protein